MDELPIRTRQEPGIAEHDNFDEIKACRDRRAGLTPGLAAGRMDA